MTIEESRTHKQFAVELFNYTWELLDKPERTKEEDRQYLLNDLRTIPGGEALAYRGEGGIIRWNTGILVAPV